MVGMRIISRSYGVLAVVALVAGVMATACGGGSTPTPTSSEVRAPAQAEATQAAPTQTPAGTEPTPTETEAPAPGSTVAAAGTPPPTTPSPTPRLVGGLVGNLAPEFLQIDSWINSEPLTMEELRGRVVLIDFWTYTCVNCIRTFPYLRDWHAKYADRGLTIVGVHAPEFAFERVRENVVESAMEHGLTYPIAQDNDFKTWRAYFNRFWPAKYLIDQDGVVRYSHFGEGDYDVTEREIRKLLEETGADVSDIVANDDPGPEFDRRAAGLGLDDRLTRELYAGYYRHVQGGPYVLHTEYADGPEQVVEYEDPGRHLNNFIYLQGSWFNGYESLVHARETENYEDYIAIKFAATSVNAVITSEDAVEEPFDVVVTLNDRPLMLEEAGADVEIRDGQSRFVVNEPRMYRIVELPEYGSHELKLSSNSSQFALFAFTFGAYDQGP